MTQTVRKAAIVAKSVSARKHPFTRGPGYKDIAFKLKAGDTVIILDETILYSWDDKPFYKCDDGFGKEGYVRADAVRLLGKERLDHERRSNH